MAHEAARQRRALARVEVLIAALERAARTGQRSVARTRRRLREQRVVEQRARVSAVAFARWAARRGLTRTAAADRLGMSGWTLGHWARGWRATGLHGRRPGRPVTHVRGAIRREVLNALTALGPRVGLPSLEGLFPEVPRVELEELRRRFRVAYRRRHRRLGYALYWRRPGWVWAMDFKTPPEPIDGCYHRILVVRDLASGLTLLALPMAGESARGVRDALVALMRWYGVPLVIKSDNAKCFRSPGVHDLLDEHGIVVLLSPPQTPRYNGGVEAGIGWLETRLHHVSAAAGHPGLWTSDDVAAARAQANETARPWGARGPTPAQSWAQRTAPRTTERERFRACCEAARVSLRAVRGAGDEAVVRGNEAATIERKAIERALLECEVLEIRKGRITPPIRRRRRANIT